MIEHLKFHYFCHYLTTMLMLKKLMEQEISEMLLLTLTIYLHSFDELVVLSRMHLNYLNQRNKMNNYFFSSFYQMVATCWHFFSFIYLSHRDLGSISYDNEDDVNVLQLDCDEFRGVCWWIVWREEEIYTFVNNETLNNFKWKRLTGILLLKVPNAIN